MKDIGYKIFGILGVALIVYGVGHAAINLREMQIESRNVVLEKQEYLALRFANYCYEHESLTPTHWDWVEFMKDPSYYDTHVKQAQEEFNCKYRGK